MKLLIQGLTIQEVEKGLSELQNALTKWDAQEFLDMSNIERIDMCGIQLLLSFQKSLHESGMTLKFSGLSPFILESFILSGCSDLLGISHE
ncbi:MAG: STAS domain-containing protein [Sulfuricurvum sp.]|nr:STAS domain-containing protein [Sulfuricurvum sp.]